MKFGKPTNCSSMGYMNTFGGGQRDAVSSHNRASMPFQQHYTYSGMGRDTFIGHDNGGQFKAWAPDV